MKKFSAFFAAILAGISYAVSAVAEKVHESLTGYMHSSGLMLSLDWQSAQQFRRNRVTMRDSSEIYRQRFYDSVLYPAAGAQQLTFFSLPVGQGITTAQGAVVGSAKTRFDCNVNLSNQLPSGKEFMIESIELIMTPGGSAAANTYTLSPPAFLIAVPVIAGVNAPNDVNVFYSSGLLNLNVLAKNYLQELTQAFPPKASLDVQGGYATNSATTLGIGSSYAKQVGRAYYLDPPITLQSAVNFEVTLDYPAAVAMPSGFNARVTCVLDGYWMRASQ